MRLHLDTWPGLARLGWPVSLTLFIRVTMRTVDILVVGIVVGASGVAAIGIGDAAARVVLMTALGLGAGTIATVSQRTGAGWRRGADAAVTQTALLAVAAGVPLTLAGWFVARPYFEVLGAAPDVVELGVPYMRIVLATATARMLAVMLTRAYQGSGDTFTPMVIRAIGTVTNIVLTVLLTPGLLGLPRLGVVGAAIGTAVGNVLSAVVLVALLASRRSGIGFRRDALWAPDTARRIMAIGWPQVAERQIYAIGAIPLNAIVLVFGTAANAGFQIGRRVMLYALLPARGIATAASAFMGLRVGARDPDDGERYGRGGLGFALVVSVAIAVPLLVWAEPTARLFLREADAIALAAAWVRVYAVAFLFQALVGVLRDSMQGAGETRLPLAATAVGTVGMLGFSWLVGVGLGVGLAGVFVGVVLDHVARIALLYRWFDRGTWRRALASAEEDARLAAEARAPTS